MNLDLIPALEVEEEKEEQAKAVPKSSSL